VKYPLLLGFLFIPAIGFAFARRRMTKRGN